MAMSASERAMRLIWGGFYMFLLLFNQFPSHRLHGLKVPGESVILRLEEQMKIAKKGFIIVYDRNFVMPTLV